MPTFFERTNLKAESRVSNDYDERRVLTIPSGNLRDLSFLFGISDLQSLILNDNKIENISPISRFPDLTRCLLNDNPISDVSVLAGNTMLEELDLSRTRVNDLSPLAKLVELRQLNLRDCPVEDVVSLSNLRKLSSLDIGGTRVTDISPLLSLSGLNSLSCAGLAIDSINTDLDVERLDVSNTNVASLDGLPRRIVSLNLTGTRVSDLTPLPTFADLKELHLADTPVVDLSPLRVLEKLTSLDISRTEIAEISALEDCVRLKHLNLADTRVSHLRGLRRCRQLETLDLSETPLHDDDELMAVLHLFRLNLAGTGLHSLDEVPILRSSYRISAELNASGCPIASLTPQFMQKIKRVVVLRLDASRLRDLSPLASLADLKVLALENGKHPIDFSFATKTRRLQSLEVTGSAFDATDLFAKIESMPMLRVLRLPERIDIDFDRFPALRSMEIYVGQNRIRYSTQ